MSLTSEEIVWMACAFDCEGSLTFSNETHSEITAFINKHKGMLSKFIDLLKKLNITYTRYPNTSPNIPATENIRILERSNKIKFLELVLPHVISKREAALRAIDYYKALEAKDPMNIILSKMEFNMYYTTPEISRLTGLSMDAVYRTLKRATKKGIITRLDKRIGNKLLHSRGR